MKTGTVQDLQELPCSVLIYIELFFSTVKYANIYKSTQKKTLKNFLIYILEDERT